MAGLDPTIQFWSRCGSRLKGGYDNKTRTPHSIALHLDPVLLQRGADLPRRETKDARCLRLNPARLFHGFDERVFAELRKTIAITFTRRRNVRAVPVSRPLGSARSCDDFAGTAGAELGGSLSRVCSPPKPYRAVSPLAGPFQSMDDRPAF